MSDVLNSLPKHTCHWPGCTRIVAPKFWGCNSHWFMLPAVLRSKLWKVYRPGQEITKTPSPAYLEVAHEIQVWIVQQRLAAKIHA